ncbi:MAG: ABC transporter permease subunit [Planctomycetes bacterium]|nr:ABC transporter permease subunit [Planctomycetota bacterium]
MRAARGGIRNHIITIAIAIVAIFCSYPNAAAAQAESAPKPQDTLAKIRARGEFLWGADSQGGAPYVFQDPMDPNHLIGFEVDLADAIAKRLGVRARPVQAQWETLLSLLARGDFDIAINGIEMADEKRRVCLLTNPYYAATEQLTVRRNDAGAPRDMASLRSHAVGTLPNSLAERILKREGAVPKTYEGGQNEIFDDLRLGRSDAVLLDTPITRYYGAIEPELEVLPGSLGDVRYAAAVRLDDRLLLDTLNGALADLNHDGTLRAIYEKWGLWNAETAALFNDPKPAAGNVAEAYDAWRAAVGKLPPFWERVRERYPATISLFARGAAVTLGVSLASMALAICVGMALAISRVYGPLPLRCAAIVYIEFMRGTPLLIQLVMIYFGLPELGIKLDPAIAGWLALGLNYAAAEAENYRAGLESVPVGQREAGRVLGLSGWQTLRFVVAPQALRVSVPPMTNDFIALLKDSSLVSLVTLTELTKTYTSLANSMRDHLGLGIVVAIWYLLISLPFARLSRVVEQRLARHLRRSAT